MSKIIKLSRSVESKRRLSTLILEDILERVTEGYKLCELGREMMYFHISEKEIKRCIRKQRKLRALKALDYAFRHGEEVFDDSESEKGEISSFNHIGIYSHITGRYDSEISLPKHEEHPPLEELYESGEFDEIKERTPISQTKLVYSKPIYAAPPRKIPETVYDDVERTFEDILKRDREIQTQLDIRAKTIRISCTYRASSKEPTKITNRPIGPGKKLLCGLSN